MRVLVTGGAGFLGSHLCERLLEDGHSVICLDNLFTGDKSNIDYLSDRSEFEFVRHDVVEPILLEVDWIFNLACPASPPHYQHNPVKTVKTNVMGTLNMLGLAKRVGARILQASTSEVYGDPAEHPQTESYWGNVNPIGPRSCYDEGKRVAETLMMDYHRQNGVDTRIVRIFNTFGPRMRPDDGRVVSNFITQAIDGESMTVYGDGTQTRSFCYVDDTVDGLIRLMECTADDVHMPVNIGNPREVTMLELAERIREASGSESGIKHMDLPPDDPARRRPDIRRAQRLLGWSPATTLEHGIEHAVHWFKFAHMGA